MSTIGTQGYVLSMKVNISISVRYTAINIIELLLAAHLKFALDFVH